MAFERFVVDAYLFSTRHDRVLRYMLCAEEAAVRVRKTALNQHMVADGDPLLAHIAPDLGDALKWVVKELRHLELNAHVYKLEKGELSPLYLPLIAELEHHAAQGSVVFFGNPRKYTNPEAAVDGMKAFGYARLETRPPKWYALEDYIAQEVDEARRKLT